MHISEQRDTPGVYSLVSLVTCNHVEIYVSAEPQTRPVSLNGTNLNWNYLEGREVIEHLFGAASGLDSVVVGEAGIAGQMRRTFTAALD